MTYKIPKIVGANGITVTYSDTETTIDGAGVGSGGVIVTEFTANGTWSKNSNTVLVEVFMWGGGGGGGTGRKGSTSEVNGGGGGGSSGGFLHMQLNPNIFGPTENITIGTGGNGAASVTVDSTNGNPGSLGNDTSIGTIITAVGGRFGAGGTSSGGSAGAATSSSIFGVGVSIGAGSSGGTSANASSAVVVIAPGCAGGGGGGGGLSVTNVAFTGGTGGGLGNGQGGGTTILVNGGNAGAINGNGGNGNVNSTGMIGGGTGGGGGGSSNSTNAGNGGNGAAPGGGGGGGGAATNGVGNTGLGGNGASGGVIIIEYLNSNDGSGNAHVGVVTGNVDMLTTGNKLVGATDTTLRFIPQRIFVAGKDVTGVGTIATATMGSNNPSYDNLLSSTNFTVGSTNEYQAFDVNPIAAGASLAPNTDIFIAVSAAGTATTQTYSVTIEGVYYTP